MAKAKEDPIEKLTQKMCELIKEFKYNTQQMIKLKLEIRKQRKIEEENIKFLQDLVKKLVTEQQTIEKTRMEYLGNILNWGIKIAILALLAYLGIKPLIP